MSTRVIFVLCLLWGASCSNAPQSESVSIHPDAFAVWEGIWENRESSGLYEQWSRVGEGFAGNGFLVAGSDTTWLEQLTLEFGQDGVFYTAEVAHNPGPVKFRLVKAGPDWTFENPVHDFPQRIVYHFEDENHLHAYVETLSEKNPQRQDFHFERVSSK